MTASITSYATLRGTMIPVSGRILFHSSSYRDPYPEPTVLGTSGLASSFENGLSVSSSLHADRETTGCLSSDAACAAQSPPFIVPCDNDTRQRSDGSSLRSLSVPSNLYAPPRTFLSATNKPAAHTPTPHSLHSFGRDSPHQFSAYRTPLPTNALTSSEFLN